MAKPLVSVIVPAYNAAHTLEVTIQSVQAQTYSNWEMVITDDCSSDHTCELVESHARRDPRIRLFRQAQNGGPALARNRSLQEARGEMVAFLDADDLWLAPKLERQVAFMERGGFGFTYTWYRWMSADGAYIGELTDAPASLNYTDYLYLTGTIPTLTVLVDRRRVTGVELPNFHAEDTLLWYHLLRQGRAYCLAEDLARYRLSPGSLSRNKWRHASWVWANFRREGLPLPEAVDCFVAYARRGLTKSVSRMVRGRYREPPQPPMCLPEAT